MKEVQSTIVAASLPAPKLRCFKAIMVEMVNMEEIINHIVGASVHVLWKSGLLLSTILIRKGQG